MMDGGQRFLKLCVNVFPKDNASMGDDRIDILESSGDNLKLDKHNRDRSNSVQKILILAIVPLVEETYYHISILFNLVKLNGINFNFVSDLKLLLIENGQQTATSSLPCPYCYISLNGLRNREDYAECHILKTFEDLRRDTYVETMRNSPP
ncbi:hypothetical protein QAD02_008368 [Eretmocerus hayati]|uniref:Uncharacterized protein n=1 Tax=Eretmocerus hayati TaxID=131215 RepID=A0ACC2N743_9HYME|nr:hypothetical protein QAD02_008368 [Eretmocerus hayati]